MPRIPLEDNFNDVINKAQLGLKITDAALAQRAEVTPEDLALVKAGEPRVAVLRRLARHLRLNPDALEDLALKRWYPLAPAFPHGFAMFNTAFGDMTVNSYLLWDSSTRLAAAFDTGADCTDMLDTIAVENLRVKHIFLTHNHPDHIADLARLADSTGADVWSSEREPVDLPGKAQGFRDGAQFHIGNLNVKTLPTWGHSPGLTTYYVTGLSWPVAICGDALFSCSMGGSVDHFEKQQRNNNAHLLRLPRDTVIAPGHGPLSTLIQERKHNPFLSR